MRILFAFAWLFAGGEQTELRLLARHLNPHQYKIEVVACLYKAHMPERTYTQLNMLGIEIDTTPYHLVHEERVAYLASKIANYDLVVACQLIPELLQAYEQVAMPPPLIEYSNLGAKALIETTHSTSRFRDESSAAIDHLPLTAHPHPTRQIPSMVDMAEFDQTRRAQHRADARVEWGISESTPVIGWIGRLDRTKRLEDFIEAAACVRSINRHACFVIIGGPDAIVPEYMQELRDLAIGLDLGTRMYFLGDRADVPRLLAGLDIFVWLSHGEGMPHVIAEAGAAGLPVIATRANGATGQITDGETALFVPAQAPGAIAAAIIQLLNDRILCSKLGENLHAKVKREHSTQLLVPRWQALFEELAVKKAVLQGVFVY